MNCMAPVARRSWRSTPLALIAAGETLVVVRLDRLARSVSHLLAVIEQLEASGAHFRSLRDQIDSSTPCRKRLSVGACHARPVWSRRHSTTPLSEGTDGSED
jgi:hypothetical protein